LTFAWIFNIYKGLGINLEKALLIGQYHILEKIPEKKIRQQVRRLGRNITQEYRSRDLFFADLVREISIPLKVDFVRVASYGSQDVSSGKITLIKDIEVPIEGKPVIIIEDIVDTGLTLSHLVNHIKEKKPESVKICALINKLERREKEIQIDYWGFEIKEGFLVGYGLDYNEQFRYLPYILSLDMRNRS
jgi:hypoxanthine phosphoribosyltransferase